MKLKIITINTWKCDGEYKSRLKVLSDQLKRLEPAIVACQECFFSEEVGADTAGWLARELGMYCSFVACRPKKRYFEDSWVESYSGMAVLSGFPIVFADVFELPAIPEDPGRKAQQVGLEFLPGKRLLITNVHLTHLAGQEALRGKQVAEVCEAAVCERAKGDFHYSLICGDFNAGVHSPEIGLLRDQAGAADCYELGGGREPRTSLRKLSNKGLVIASTIFSVCRKQGLLPFFIPALQTLKWC